MIKFILVFVVLFLLPFFMFNAMDNKNEDIIKLIGISSFLSVTDPIFNIETMVDIITNGDL